MYGFLERSFFNVFLVVNELLIVVTLNRQAICLVSFPQYEKVVHFAFCVSLCSEPLSYSLHSLIHSRYLDHLRPKHSPQNTILKHSVYDSSSMSATRFHNLTQQRAKLYFCLSRSLNPWTTSWKIENSATKYSKKSLNSTCS
jgi:hypothetical protein